MSDAWQTLRGRVADIRKQYNVSDDDLSDLVFALFLAHERQRHTVDIQVIDMDITKKAAQLGVPYKLIVKAGSDMGRFEV